MKPLLYTRMSGYLFTSSYGYSGISLFLKIEKYKMKFLSILSPKLRKKGIFSKTRNKLVRFGYYVKMIQLFFSILEILPINNLTQVLHCHYDSCDPVSAHHLHVTLLLPSKDQIYSIIGKISIKY